MASPELKRLDIGCGASKLPGYIGMDIYPAPGVEIIHSFDSIPYPFENDSFDEVKMYNALEHVQNFFGTVLEVHRLLKPGGMFRVLCPHFSGSDAYRDPTHRTFFAYTTFNAFTAEPGYGSDYSGKFKIVRRHFGMPGSSKWRLSALPKAFGNRFPDFYERNLCWLMPARTIYYELEAIKPGAL